jgi:hypothetical protein
MKTGILKRAAKFEAKLRQLPKAEQRHIEAMIDEMLDKAAAKSKVKQPLKTSR